MSVKTTYGFVLAFVGIVLALTGYLLGLQTDKAGSALASLFGWVGTILTFFILWLGVRAEREGRPDQRITFGQGFVTGILITLIGAGIGAVYTFMHFSFINPEFGDHMMVMIQQKWAETGMTGRQMDAAEKVTRIFFHPAVMAVTGFLAQLFFGVIFSLIVAAILKRNPLAPAAVPPLVV